MAAAAANRNRKLGKGEEESNTPTFMFYDSIPFHSISNFYSRTVCLRGFEMIIGSKTVNSRQTEISHCACIEIEDY